MIKFILEKYKMVIFVLTLLLSVAVPTTYAIDTQLLRGKDKVIIQLPTVEIYLGVWNDQNANADFDNSEFWLSGVQIDLQEIGVDGNNDTWSTTVIVNGEYNPIEIPMNRALLITLDESTLPPEYVGQATYDYDLLSNPQAVADGWLAVDNQTTYIYADDGTHQPLSVYFGYQYTGQLQDTIANDIR